MEFNNIHLDCNNPIIWSLVTRAQQIVLEEN